MTFLKMNGTVLHHKVRLSGKTSVVFLNSLGTDLRIWDDVASLLPDDWTVLQIDKRGHGLSETGDADMKTYAADVAALMDHYCLGPALICGVSIGGMIAQQLFHARSDLVSSMVLSNTAARIGDAASWQARLDQLDEVGLEALADGILERWFSAAFRFDRPSDLQGYRSMLARTPAEGYATACRAIRDTDLRDQTSQIDAPVICISGTEDLATPSHIVAQFAQSIPKASVVEISGAGHLPCIETPSEVAAVIKGIAQQG